MTHAIATGCPHVRRQYASVRAARLCTPPRAGEAGKIARQAKGCLHSRRTSRNAAVAPMTWANVTSVNASGGELS